MTHLKELESKLRNTPGNTHDYEYILRAIIAAKLSGGKDIERDMRELNMQGVAV